MRYTVEVPGRTEGSRNSKELVEAHYWKVADNGTLFFCDEHGDNFKAYARGYWRMIK